MGSFGSPAVDRLERLGPGAFQGDRLARPGTWAVGFFAQWCGFCQAFAPSFAGLDGGATHLAVGDLTDLHNPLWERFDIEIVPTVIVFRDGKAVLRVDGRPMEGLGSEDLEAVQHALAPTRKR